MCPGGVSFRELGGEVEAYLGEIGLRHLQHIVAVGKEYVATVLVGSHELVLSLLEGFESFRVIALNPACLVEAYGLPPALRAVFVQKTVLDHLELELTDGADDFSSVELVGEQLRHTFVHKLVYAFVELLGFHRVGVLDVYLNISGEKLGNPLKCISSPG